jgi:hypothetical protein
MKIIWTLFIYLRNFCLSNQTGSSWKHIILWSLTYDGSTCDFQLYHGAKLIPIQ